MACPAHWHSIEAGEYEDEAIEKYPVRFEIDELRCIVCGFCVEACPKDAIRMDTGTHAPAVLSRPLAVFDKAALMTGPAVEHPTDVLTYRVPLRTAVPRDPEGPGVTGSRLNGRAISGRCAAAPVSARRRPSDHDPGVDRLAASRARAPRGCGLHSIAIVVRIAVPADLPDHSSPGDLRQRPVRALMNLLFGSDWPKSRTAPKSTR